MLWVLPEWMQVINYDPALSEWSADPSPEDYLICTDVLEHIEPQLIDNVIDHLISKFRKKAFLAIDMKESKKSLPSGRNAHLIIEDLHYWIKKFEGHCNIKTLTNDYILYLELTKSKE